MANEDWKLQVSYTVPNGPMINVRANTGDELSVLLEGIGDYSVQIASVQALIKAAFVALPLATTASTVDTPPWESFGATQAAPAFAGAPAATPPAQSGLPTTPTCHHGARIFRQGVSKSTGKPYAFWACPTPQGTPDQCKPQN